MQDSKLLQLIQTLSKEELKTFGNYLEGASHRKTGSVYALYNYFKKLYPDFPEKKVKKEFVYGKIMPKGKAYNDKRIRDLMSILTLNLENFIIAKELEDNEPERELLLLNALKKRKQDKLFFQKVKQLERKWEKNPPKGIIKYHYKYLLQKEYYSHPNFSVYAEKGMSLHNLMEKIDHYYFASKLYCTVSLLQTQHHLNPTDRDNTISLIQEISQEGEKDIYNTNAYIKILNIFFHIYTKKDFSNNETLKALYIKNFSSFNKTEQLDLFLMLQGYYYYYYQQGKEEYLKEIFELNKFAVENNIILEDGVISNDIFRNIVGASCSVEEFEWAKIFIKDYQKYIDKTKQKDIVLLCEAKIGFYQKDFEICLEKLLLVKFQDVLYGIQVRALQLQCYYELDEYEESFYNLAHSFSTFLHRNQNISSNIKELYLNFIQFIKKLHKAKQFPNSTKEDLTIILGKYKKIINKRWLIKKAVELFPQKYPNSL